jgi:hypothetical protein
MLAELLHAGDAGTGTHAPRCKGSSPMLLAWLRSSALLLGVQLTSSAGVLHAPCSSTTFSGTVINTRQS